MNKFFNTVNQKALLIVSFIFLLSFILIISSFWFKGSMREVYNLIDHANDVEIALRDILFKVKDCEADMRAYVITNQESYYSNFIANKAYVMQKVRDLRVLVKDSQQISNAIVLEGWLERRFRILDEMTHLSDTIDLPEFHHIVGKGEIISEKIEGHLAAMVAHEKEYLADHEQELFSLMDIRRRVSIFSSILAMILGVFIFRLIREESLLIQKRQELLQELNDNKDKFFSIISHDLKNPFTAIKGFIEMLNHPEYSKRKEDLDAICTRLKSSSERFDKLLNDLLTWARLQMDAITVTIERIDLNELLYQVSEPYKALIESKNLTMELQAEKPAHVFADKAMTETIIRNLISNAVKFTHEGKITLSSYQYSGHVVVEVSDTGVGMDESVMLDLFKLGKVKSQRGTRNETGTGMGLILCKDMAERQGGKLEISSAPGAGTTVKLFFNRG